MFSINICYSQSYIYDSRTDYGGLPNYSVVEYQILNDSTFLRKSFEIIKKSNLKLYNNFIPEIDSITVLNNGKEYIMKKKINNSSGICTDTKYVIKKHKLKIYVRICNRKWKLAMSLKKI